MLGSLLVVTLASATSARLDSGGAHGSADTRIVAGVRGSIGADIPALQAAPSTRAAGDAAAAALVHASRVVTLSAAAIIALGLLATLALPAAAAPVRRE